MVKNKLLFLAAMTFRKLLSSVCSSKKALDCVIDTTDTKQLITQLLIQLSCFSIIVNMVAEVRHLKLKLFSTYIQQRKLIQLCSYLVTVSIYNKVFWNTLEMTAFHFSILYFIMTAKLT